MKRTFALLVLLAAAAPSTALADAWPALTHPQDARIEPAGERVRVNGVPIRLTRVITTLPADAAAAFLTEQGETVSRIGVIRARNGDEHQTQVA